MTAATARGLDVVIVGGGMAGASLAAELASTHSVALLEQEDELGYHATGRSAAAFLQSYGSPEARALTRASRPLLETVDAAAPVLTPRPFLWIAGAEQRRSLADLLAQQPRLTPLDAADARALCSVLRPDAVAGAALEADACDIDVAALHQHYVSSALRRGVDVRRSSRLEDATRHGNRWRLRHTTGELQAEVVVNAAGAWADRVSGLLGAHACGLRPLRRTIAIARTAREVARSWPLVVDVDERFYFRPEGPHVLVSPADETPSEPGDARPEEADVALALERVNGVTSLELRSVVTTWAGLRTFAPDRNPVVGFDPDVPGLFWLAGQGGYGIQTAAALARLAAALVRDDRSFVGDLDDLDGLDLDGLDLARLRPDRFRL